MAVPSIDEASRLLRLRCSVACVEDLPEEGQLSVSIGPEGDAVAAQKLFKQQVDARTGAVFRQYTGTKRPRGCLAWGPWRFQQPSQREREGTEGKRSGREGCRAGRQAGGRENDRKREREIT